MIFGLKIKKLLYIGMYNKFCAACIQPNSTSKNTCFKNWNGSSSAMETQKSNMACGAPSLLEMVTALCIQHWLLVSLGGDMQLKNRNVLIMH